MAGMEDPVDFLLFDVIVFLGFGVSELFRGRAPTDETVTDRSFSTPLPVVVGRDIPIYLRQQVTFKRTQLLPVLHGPKTVQL